MTTPPTATAQCQFCHRWTGHAIGCAAIGPATRVYECTTCHRVITGQVSDARLYRRYAPYDCVCGGLLVVPDDRPLRPSEQP